MRLDCKGSASVDVVSGMSQYSVLEPLLFILYTFEGFHIVGNHIVGWADNMTIYAVISSPHSRPQVMESLNYDFAPIDSLTYAPSYGDLALGVAELEEVKSLRILGVTLDSKLTFETYLREFVSKAARSMVSCAEQESYSVVHVCSRAVSMHMFFQLSVFCAPVWISSAESHLGLLMVFVVRKGCVRINFVVWGTE